MDDIVSFSLEFNLEFASARNFAPYMRSDLPLTWSDRVFMTDASPTGGAVVQTIAGLDEIKQEAAWGSPGTWLVLRPGVGGRSDDEMLAEIDSENLGASAGSGARNAKARAPAAGSGACNA